MSRQVLNTVTVSAYDGKSSRPASQQGGTWELFGVTIDKSPHIIWHTYVLLEDAPPPAVVRAVIRGALNNGVDVAILSVHGHRATCLPMAGGQILNVDFISLEIAPGTDAADVRALYQS